MRHVEPCSIARRLGSVDSRCAPSIVQLANETEKRVVRSLDHRLVVRDVVAGLRSVHRQSETQGPADAVRRTGHAESVGSFRCA